MMESFCFPILSSSFLQKLFNLHKTSKRFLVSLLTFINSRYDCPVKCFKAPNSDTVTRTCLTISRVLFWQAEPAEQLPQFSFSTIMAADRLDQGKHFNDVPKTLHSEDEGALSKILSTVLARNTVSTSNQSARDSRITRSNLVSDQADDHILQSLDRRWVSPIKVRNSEKGEELKDLLSQAQQHFATVEVLQQHLTRFPKCQNVPAKGLSRPTAATNAKGQARTKVASGLIEEATVQSELFRTFKTLKDLHKKLKEAFKTLESREVQVKEAERILQSARSSEFLHLATEIPRAREQLESKSIKLAELEEGLQEERNILIDSVRELQDIRAKIEAKDVKAQQETIAANELRLRLQVDKLNLEAALGDLARRQRLQEERSILIESAEVELARGKLLLSERENELRRKALSLQVRSFASGISR
jgi:hypothetical protein